MLDGTKQLRVLLTDDRIELRSTHSGLLHLLEGFAGIYALMLPCITDKQHPVLRPDLFHERLHLARACETRFIHHVEMTAFGIAGHLLLSPSR